MLCHYFVFQVCVLLGERKEQFVLHTLEKVQLGEFDSVYSAATFPRKHRKNSKKTVAC